MAAQLQSNPLYYAPSSLPTSAPTRTVFLEKKGNQNSFGVYVGQDVPNGLYVVTVELGSPAAEARIQPGDRVVAVNDQYVAQMTGNPKRTLMDLAMRSPTLSLTIQSTNIFQQLNLPPPNLTSHDSTTISTSLPYPPALPVRRPFRPRTPEVNVDLERYFPFDRSVSSLAFVLAVTSNLSSATKIFKSCRRRLILRIRMNLF